MTETDENKDPLSIETQPWRTIDMIIKIGILTGVLWGQVIGIIYNILTPGNREKCDRGDE